MHVAFREIKKISCPVESLHNRKNDWIGANLFESYDMKKKSFYTMLNRL
jgi:hypothetical protein